MKSSIFLKRVTVFEKAVYARHLLRLNDDDRYLRFGRHVKNKLILDFVNETNYSKVCVIGAFDEDLEIVGAVHIVTSKDKEGKNFAEIALSVDKEYRSQGLAQKLSARALSWRQMRYIKGIEVQWLSHNNPVAHLVKYFGGEVQTEEEESTAVFSFEKPEFIQIVKEKLKRNLEFLHYTIFINKRFFRKINFIFFKKPVKSGI